MHHLVFNQQISMRHEVVFWDFRRETGCWPVWRGPAWKDRSSWLQAAKLSGTLEVQQQGGREEWEIGSSRVEEGSGK